MYGSNDMGTIAVEVSNDNGVSWTTVWNESGNKGNSWMNASIDLSEYVGGGIQLRFNRITGGTWKADIAIDNIALTTGYVAARQEAVATKVKDSPTTTKNKETVAVEEFYEEEELNTLTVFPNPVRGNILNIKLDTGSATSYRITNLYGQAVLAGTASNQIKVDRLKSGIYFIEVSDGTNTLTKKFIKQ